MKCFVASDHVFIDGGAKSGQRRRHQRSSHASTTHGVDRAVKCAVFAAIAAATRASSAERINEIVILPGHTKRSQVVSPLPHT
jgi:hypothetical protein